MDFKAIEQRARDVARQAAIDQVIGFREQLIKSAGVYNGFGGAPEEFRKAWAPMAVYLQDMLTQRNLAAYHGKAEQAAIDALRQIINAPKT